MTTKPKPNPTLTKLYAAMNPDAAVEILGWPAIFRGPTSEIIFLRVPAISLPKALIIAKSYGFNVLDPVPGRGFPEDYNGSSMEPGCYCVRIAPTGL